jgi:CheY-like chemotaxis protein
MNKKLKILLVDSDMEFVEKSKSALEASGFEVVVVSSGNEALNKVRFEEPDIVVMDNMLEKHDSGFIVSKALKADPIYKRIPILMVSSSKEKTGIDFSQELDGYWMKTDAFVTKPVETEQLVALVKDLNAAKAA